MDAYNRGYGAGIADGGADDSDGLGEVGRIGNATLLARSDIGIGDADYVAWQLLRRRLYHGRGRPRGAGGQDSHLRPPFNPLTAAARDPSTPTLPSPPTIATYPPTASQP